MICEHCNGVAHRDDAMNRRCNGCERLTKQCICNPVSETLFEIQAAKVVSSKPTAERSVYCPSCDKRFTSLISKVAAMAIMREHLAKCNPQLLPSTRD